MDNRRTLNNHTTHAALARQVEQQRKLNRDVLWRAAWLRVQYGMGFDASLQQAQQESADREVDRQVGDFFGPRKSSAK